MNPSNIEEKEVECLENKIGKLISAVREGNLEIVKELVNSFGPTYLKEWPEGNQLLRDAVCINREIAKVLLLNGSKVNNDHEFCSTPLHFAAINGDVEIAEMFLDRGAKINARDSCGRSSLHHAITENEIEMAKLLLNRKACVNISDRDGNTPLHCAVAKGCEDFTRLLLHFNPDVNISGDGGTPLHIAAQEGNLQIISDLFNQGASVNSVCTLTGCTPLHLAVADGKLEVARLLLSKGADVNAVTKSNVSPLYLAVKAGNKTTLKVLLEHGADVDVQEEDGRTVLCYAVERGTSDIVKEILKYSPDCLNESNRRCFHSCIEKNRREIVESFVEHGFGVSPKDVNNGQLLESAIKFGYLSIVEQLVYYGANVNMRYRSCRTLLHTAIIYLQANVAAYLIKCGADVNAEDKDKRTPIFYAVQNGDATITKLLVANGAGTKNYIDLLNTAIIKGHIKIVKYLLQFIPDINVNLRDKDGRTALHCTVLRPGNESVNGDIAKLLLCKGAKVDIRPENGVPVLHAAIKNGDVKLVEVLLDTIIDVNSVVDGETTALYMSAQQGHEIITRMLLNKGAMVNAKTEDGTTALHVATEMGHARIVEMLLEYGAEVNCKSYVNVTPLHVAVEDKLEIVKILIKFGADVNAVNDCGRTPLHTTCELGLNSITLSLLQNGGDINVMCDNKFLLTYTDLFFHHEHGIYHLYDIENTRIIIRHMVKLIANESFVHEDYFNAINSNPELKYYYSVCEKEIQKMKNEKIYNTNVSFYNILINDLRQLTIYAGNESIVEALESTKCAEMFPIYADALEHQLKKGQERQCLETSGIKCFNFLFGYELPHFLINNIFSYLNNLDLRKLIKAYPVMK